MHDTESNTDEAQYETVESLDIEEGDYFPLDKINRAYYGFEADEDEWEVVFRTASLSENESAHLVRDPESTYVLFWTNIDNDHKVKQIGDEVEAEPVTPDGEEMPAWVTDCFYENVIGDRGNIWAAEFRSGELHIELEIKDGWDDEVLETLKQASRRDVAYEVNLVREGGEGE
jgi:hypothetical protein